jgi:glutathione S-transferase
MTIRLFYSPGACSFAPHILLNEIQIPFELMLTALGEGAHKKPEFLEINPKGRVPVLQHNDQTITEVPAILFYLSSLRPELQLMGCAVLEITPYFGIFQLVVRNTSRPGVCTNMASRGIMDKTCC